MVNVRRWSWAANQVALRVSGESSTFRTSRVQWPRPGEWRVGKVLHVTLAHMEVGNVPRKAMPDLAIGEREGALPEVERPPLHHRQRAILIDRCIDPNLREVVVLGQEHFGEQRGGEGPEEWQPDRDEDEQRQQKVEQPDLDVAPPALELSLDPPI